jgi:hypothetical protein
MTSSLAQRDLLAEETHAGRIWALLILPAIVGPAVSVALFPTGPAGFALVIVGIVGMSALAMVLSGFQYRFLRDRVEIRTLGFLLRTIPRQGIMSYSIEPWNVSRGYGLRARPGVRAYVWGNWGNKVVRIETTNGELYLGHSDPEAIMQHLDQITGFAMRRPTAVPAR